MLALYNNAYSTCSQKVRLCLHEKGLEWEDRQIDFRLNEHLAHPDGAEVFQHACRMGLVLLCHKFWCPFRAAQHGQRESVVARAATNLRRIVAIEFGTWRSGRNGGSSGLVTFA